MYAQGGILNEMKNTKKISIMSGLVTIGVLLCGVHIANAQTNIDSGYTITIPSEVGIDKDSGKGSFSVSGKMDAQTELDVTTTSQNDYKLKCGSQFIDYTLDKQSFHIDNIKSANPKNFNEDFNITLANTNTNYSGPYKDRLAFNIQCHKYTYELDMNSILDGVRENERHNYGAVDVYINGVLKAENVSDFKEILNYGDTYEFKNIKATDGHHFVGINSCANTSIKGRIGADTNYLETRRDNPYNLVAPIYFEFNTNRLTINYHADGAQSWKTSSTNNATEVDVSGKDIMETEHLKYNELYDEDVGKQHFCSIVRIKRDGYTAKANTWKVGQKGSLELLDYKILQRTQDVAEYCGVLNQFKKNDTTIDLYPIWIPNTYTLTYDLYGGSFNASTTQLFKYGSGDAISSEIPNKAGYDFVGWKWGDVTMQPGETIPKEWGNFTLTAQWKEAYSAGTTLNIEGSQYIVIEQKDNDKYLVIKKESIGSKKFQSTYDRSTGLRSDGENASTYEGSEIDNYIENEWYNGLSSTMKMAIQATNIKQASYKTYNDPDSKQETGYNIQVYNTISRHAFLPSVSEIGKAVNLKNPDKVKAFLNGTSIWTRDSYQGNALAAEYLSAGSGSLSTNRVYGTFGVRPAFVIDLSKVDYTVTGTVNYK